LQLQKVRFSLPVKAWNHEKYPVPSAGAAAACAWLLMFVSCYMNADRRSFAAVLLAPAAS
jgi:hypothetical protein